MFTAVLAISAIACGGLGAAPTATPVPTATTAPTSTPEPTAVPTEVPTEEAQGEQLDENVTSFEVDSESTRYELTDGISITLPARWLYLSPDPEQMAAAMESVVAANPDFGAALTTQMQSMAAAGIKFMAIDAGDAEGMMSGFVSNVNILAQPSGGVTDVQVYLDAMPAGLATQLGIDETAIQTEVVDLNGIEAGRVEYTNVMQNPNGGEALDLVFIQYLVPGSTNVYIVTFTAPASRIDELRPVIDDIAASITISE